MIKVNVDLYRFGSREGEKRIGQLFVWNKGAVSLFRYQYGYMFLIPDAPEYDHIRDVPDEHIERQGEVEHTREDGIWWLLERVFWEYRGDPDAS